jgi:hypothetical protein
MSVTRELQRRVGAEKSSVLRFEPCLPKLAKAPPAGPGWIHEIKHAFGFWHIGEAAAFDCSRETAMTLRIASHSPIHPVFGNLALSRHTPSSRMRGRTSTRS